MKFTETTIPGVMLIEQEPSRDERGFFARIWEPEAFDAHGLHDRYVQWSVSRNTRRGTLRGMHFQLPPSAESKLVRCTRGAIYDVVIDLRRQSDTYRQWFAVELSADNLRGLRIPSGCAHGFQTLENDTDVEYAISTAYDASAARGARWDDPAIGIQWPRTETLILSDRDRSFPDFSDLERELPDSWLPDEHRKEHHVRP
jgi:dTDP-4-dehydrorhamnose 3,5-epimerase